MRWQRTALMLLALLFEIRNMFADENVTATPKIRVKYDARNVSLVLQTILRNYDPNIRPFSNEKPVPVTVDITVLGITKINERSMEFSFHCYFRQKWPDPRLKFEVSYSKQDLVYKWNGIRMDKVEESKFSQFRLLNMPIQEIDADSMTYRGETASVLEAKFVLLREKGYFLLQIYTPCSMIVALSWVSFWINKEAAIARCSLGVMTVLSLTTLRQGVEDEFPPVDYATAIDVFILVSFVFCYSALVEYIVIHYNSLMRRRRFKKQLDDMKSGRIMLVDPTFDGDRKLKLTGKLTKAFRRKILRSRQSSSRSFGSLLKQRLGCIQSHKQPPPIEIQRLNGAGLTAMTHGFIYTDETTPVAAGPLLCASVEDDDGDCDVVPGGERRDGISFTVRERRRDTAELIDYYSKYAFPLAYTAFHVVYWSLYMFWLPD